MSRKSFAVGTGAIALSPFVAIAGDVEERRREIVAEYELLPASPWAIFGL